jgi:hypothetical protein
MVWNVKRNAEGVANGNVVEKTNTSVKKVFAVINFVENITHFLTGLNVPE